MAAESSLGHGVSALASPPCVAVDSPPVAIEVVSVPLGHGVSVLLSPLWFAVVVEALPLVVTVVVESSLGQGVLALFPLP